MHENSAADVAAEKMPNPTDAITTGWTGIELVIEKCSMKGHQQVVI